MGGGDVQGDITLLTANQPTWKICLKHLHFMFSTKCKLTILDLGKGLAVEAQHKYNRFKTHLLSSYLS